MPPKDAIPDKPAPPRRNVHLGLIDRIRMGLFGVRLEEIIKEKKRKDLRKQLDKFEKNLYTSRNRIVDARFGRFMYDFYCTLYPFIAPMKKDFVANHGAAVKNYIIAQNLSPEQQEIMQNLSEDKLHHLIGQHGFKESLDIISQETNRLGHLFPEASAGRMNHAYNRLLDFSRLACYDFFSLMKSFDDKFDEDPQQYTPHFHDEDGKYMVEDLTRLDVCLVSLEFDQALFELLLWYQQFLGQEISDKKAIKKLFAMAQRLKKHHVLPCLVRLITDNLDFQSAPVHSNENIILAFANTFYQQTKVVWESLRNTYRDKQIKSAENKLFADVQISGLKHYTAEDSERLKNAQVTGYAFHEPLAYQRTFFIEKYNRHIQGMVNELLLQGQFTESGLSRSVTDIYYRLNKVLPAMREFDERLDPETGDNGKLIKGYIHRAGNDPKAKEFLEKLIMEQNEDAKRLLVGGLRPLLQLEKILRKLVTEHKAGKETDVVNLGTISGKTNKEYLASMAQAVNDIVYLVQLMKFYVNLAQ